MSPLCGWMTWSEWKARAAAKCRPGHGYVVDHSMIRCFAQDMLAFSTSIESSGVRLHECQMNGRNSSGLSQL